MPFGAYPLVDGKIMASCPNVIGNNEVSTNESLPP